MDFVRLLDLADRRFVSEGERLSEAGRVQDEVFLIVEGTAEVRYDYTGILGNIKYLVQVFSPAFSAVFYLVH